VAVAVDFAVVLNRRKIKRNFFQTEAFAAVLKPLVTLDGKFEIKKIHWKFKYNRRKLWGGQKLPETLFAIFFSV
jgi:hypothetical protein